MAQSQEEQQLAFFSGLNADGTLAANSFSTWKGDEPATYGTSSSIFKWGGTTAGSAGGNVTYAFDVGSNWTAAEKEALSSGLNMWSAVANISFTASSGSNANITFQRNNTDDAFASFGSILHPVGSSTLAPPQDGVISMDITGDTSSSRSSYGYLGSFTASGGYGVMTTLHEVGHALGLDHTGFYNGTVDSATQQYTPYDNKAFSIMSYIDPADTGAKFAGANPLPGTNWNGQSPTTWMPLDIDAIQRIYGGPTNRSPLTVGQTFGYNTTLTGSLRPYFDFTVNTAPVVTLYNTAANNTLDLSGSAKAATVDLNSGSYSSTHGMTNNIAIHKSTVIDKVITGAGDDRITLGSVATTVDGGAGRNTAVFAGNRSEYEIGTLGADNTFSVKRTGTGVTDRLSNIQTLTFKDQSVAAPVCFVTGTLIRTSRGEVAVEDLRVGDRAVTASGALRPVTWIGHRTIAAEGGALPFSQQPVRVRAGAFGGGLPVRDLCLSPGHPVLVGADADNEGGVLVPVMCLINGTTIAREARAGVTYWHVELDSHDILLAEGLPAESYLDGGDRAFFAEASDHALHDPDFVAPGWAGRCRPVAVEGAMVEAERLRLDAVFAGSLHGHCAWDADAAAWLAE